MPSRAYTAPEKKSTFGYRGLPFSSMRERKSRSSSFRISR